MQGWGWLCCLFPPEDAQQNVRGPAAVHLPAPPTCSARSASFLLPCPQCCRFERPDSRNRWDSPLFTLRPLLGSSQMQEQLDAISAAVGDAPRQAAAAAAAGSQGEAAAAAGAADGAPPVLLAKKLTPHVATDTTASKLSGDGSRICAGATHKPSLLPCCGPASRCQHVASLALLC